MADSAREAQLNDIDSLENIRFMVNSFYSHVRKDKLLGPIFEEAISDWETHLPTMYQFWERLLFGTGEYKGNPFQKHVDLPVEKEHFASWVQLFSQNIDDNFSGPRAEEAKRLARSIAGTFQLRMGLVPNDFEFAVPNYSRH